MFAELDKILGYENADDFWYDLEIMDAMEVVCKFSLSDWEQLISVSSGRPPLWRARCAEVLDGFGSMRKGGISKIPRF
jgi:hypothetical protein